MRHDRSHLARDSLNPAAKLAAEDHEFAAPRFAVENGTLWNGEAQHLLEAQTLSAQLHTIGVVDFGPAALIFDREGDFAVAVGPMNLDNVGLTYEPQPVGDEWEGTVGLERAAGHRLALLYSPMQQTASHRKSVLRPYPLEMDQGELARAEDEVL